jgi:hypothetical protein
VGDEETIDEWRLSCIYTISEKFPFLSFQGFSLMPSDVDLRHII